MTANFIERPLDKAKRLPCWRGLVEPQPLDGGLSNHNYLVEDAGTKYVVRIGGDAPMHNVMRFNEQTCGRAAAVIGIAPQQVYTQADALVMDFIEGTTLDAELVQTNIAQILPPLKTLHQAGSRAVRGAVLGFSVFHVARCYQKLLDESDCRSAVELPRLMKISAQLEAAVGAIEPALCHNDLLAANFIDDGERIWIIDWEHAGFNTPLFDLANIASNSVFPEALEREMLERYYGEAASKALWRRFKALRAASHQRETMWSMVAEIYSELDQTVNQNFIAYTEKNLDDFNRAYEEFLRYA
ncbi:phosphotransferase [Candidatus Spongiihabitans sp.]|uniref:phosphotransferase n=1 Tax=Candidatus Spongiihabitans sp. TaxID=3101308 RepID=UPI003C6FB5EB